jgi:hypothetical protein
MLTADTGNECWYRIVLRGIVHVQVRDAVVSPANYEDSISDRPLPDMRRSSGRFWPAIDRHCHSGLSSAANIVLLLGFQGEL